MSISFQDIYTRALDIEWLKQPFSGFNLDSRKVQIGQIFIALTSYSQPEKTLSFAQKAL